MLEHPSVFFVPDSSVLNEFSGPCALIQFIEDGSDNAEDDDQEDPEDICEKNCDDAMQPVCVNGNRSFGNRCQMEVSICKEGIDAKSIKNGKCPDCSSKGCSDEEDFVCGTNGITFKNECILQKVACEKLTENLEVQHYGKCKSENEIGNVQFLNFGTFRQFLSY